MSGICVTSMPAGQVECTEKEFQTRYLVVDDLSVSFTNVADFINSNTNKALINEPVSNKIRSYIIPIADYEPGTADATQTTFNSTKNVVIDRPIPNGVYYADLSYCDSSELVRTFKGGDYRVRMISIKNQMKGYLRSDGSIKGFKASVTAITRGLPQKADVDKNFPLYVNFASYEEFENPILVVPNFNGLDLMEAIPAGLNMTPTGAYATGDLPVQINSRCSDGSTGLVTADFVVISASVSDVTIVSVEGSNGAYTLTIQKDLTPTDLVAGDTVTFQVQQKTGDPILLISNLVTLTV